MHLQASCCALANLILTSAFFECPMTLNQSVLIFCLLKCFTKLIMFCFLRIAALHQTSLWFYLIKLYVSFPFKHKHQSGFSNARMPTTAAIFPLVRRRYGLGEFCCTRGQASFLTGGRCASHRAEFRSRGIGR